jgi:ATP-dependent DNA helicase RecG
MTRRLDREPIKVRILSLVKGRPFSNKDIRNFSDLGRKQVTGLLKELEADGQIFSLGHGAGAYWHLQTKD